MDAEYRGPPQGSLAWHAQLFCPAAQHPVIAALHHVWSEIRGIGLSMQDPVPARLRLAWWGEELGLLAEGRPRHPATRALLPHCPQPPRAARLLEELLLAGEDDIDGAGCENLDELRLYAFRSDGAALALLCELLGAPETQGVEVGREAGLAIAANRALTALGADLHHRRRPLVPWPLLQETGLTDERSPEPARVEPVLTALGEVADQAAGALAQAAIGAGDEVRFARLLALLHIAEGKRARRLLVRELPAEPIRLGAVGRLYLAWRGAMVITREET